MSEIALLLRVAREFADDPTEHFFYYDAEGTGESERETDLLLWRLVLEELESHDGRDVKRAVVGELRAAFESRAREPEAASTRKGTGS